MICTILLVFSAPVISEINLGEVEAFGFTSDGFYCQAKMQFSWEYSGDDSILINRIRDHVSGYIESRLKVLFLEQLKQTRGSTILMIKQSDDNSVEEKGLLRNLVTIVNEEMDQEEQFDFVSLKSLTIVKVECVDSDIQVK